MLGVCYVTHFYFQNSIHYLYLTYCITRKYHYGTYTMGCRHVMLRYQVMTIGIIKIPTRGLTFTLWSTQAQGVVKITWAMAIRAPMDYWPCFKEWDKYLTKKQVYAKNKTFKLWQGFFIGRQVFLYFPSNIQIHLDK